MTTIVAHRNQSRGRSGLLLTAALAGLAILSSRSSSLEQTSHKVCYGRVNDPKKEEMSTWRRTRDGWEQARWLAPKQPPYAAPLHPFHVAALTILLAAMALVGFAPRGREATAAPRPHISPTKKKRLILSPARSILETVVPPSSGLRNVAAKTKIPCRSPPEL